MRTDLDQLTDLTEEILKGLKNIRRRRLIKYAYPIVLEGPEGVILRNCLELIAAGDKDTTFLKKYAGSVFFEKSLILCSEEFQLPGFELTPVIIE